MSTGLIKNRNKLMLSIPFTTIPIYLLVSLKFSQNVKKENTVLSVSVVYNIGSRVISEVYTKTYMHLFPYQYTNNKRSITPYSTKRVKWILTVNKLQTSFL